MELNTIIKKLQGVMNLEFEERAIIFKKYRDILTSGKRAVVHDRIVGFSRCEGNLLKRIAHKVEFGVCVLKDYWGYGIGKNLLKESIAWADSNGIKKITLNVLETNEKAINLYEKFGFKTEGILKNDKVLSDGKYYNAVVMGRFNE